MEACEGNFFPQRIKGSFSTIIPSGGQLLVAGGDFPTAHDPKGGKELWRLGTWNPGHKQEWWRLVPSPVVGAGRVLVCAPKTRLSTRSHYH